MIDRKLLTKKIGIVYFIDTRKELRIDDRLLASSTFYVLAFAYRLHNLTVRDNSWTRETVIGITEWSER